MMKFLGVTMKSLLLGLALAMSAALPAMAENWVYVGTTNDGRTDSSIDVDSISPFNGGYAYKGMFVTDTDNEYLITYNAILCEQRYYKIAGHDSYTRNGRLTSSVRNPNKPFTPILVNSTTSAIWERLCN